MYVFTVLLYGKILNSLKKKLKVINVIFNKNYKNINLLQMNIALKRLKKDTK